MKDICFLIVESKHSTTAELLLDLATEDVSNPYAWLSDNMIFSCNNIFPVPEDLHDEEEILIWKLDNWGSSSDFEDLVYEAVLAENDGLSVYLKFKTSGGPPLKIIDELIASHPDAVITFLVYSEYSEVITRVTADSNIYIRETITPNDLRYYGVKQDITSDVFVYEALYG